MQDTKIFTYVSPKTDQRVANGICARLHVISKPVGSVEELFPLMSDPNYYTDFIAISIEMFSKRHDGLDMFDIINTLATLIKSTVYRIPGGRPKKRDTKIFVIVDETTDPILVKQVINFPNISTVGWILKREEDFESTLRHVSNLIAGDFSHHELVLELIKSKKKTIEKKDVVILTVRQAQILQIVQERGISNKAIAKMLGLSESTVKLHIGAILKKYSVKNRTQLALFSRNQNNN